MSGIEMAGLGYVCRHCETPKMVYVLVHEAEDGERFVDAHDVRLHKGRCDECDQERTHVADVDVADAALETHPIDRRRSR